MSYFDPRAELDYSGFQEVDPELDNATGYFQAKVVARPGSVDADNIGPLPRQTPFAPGEREAFQAARDRLDRAMQVAGIVPNTPQEWQTTPDLYERLLLNVLAKHTESYTKADCLSAGAERLQRLRDGVGDVPGIVAEALAEPHRKGVLREVKIVDATGREIREFVGPKRAWMNPLKAPLQVSPIYVDGRPHRT